jgi:hypothetical protein
MLMVLVAVLVAVLVVEGLVKNNTKVGGHF